MTYAHDNEAAGRAAPWGSEGDSWDAPPEVPTLRAIHSQVTPPAVPPMEAPSAHFQEAGGDDAQYEEDVLDEEDYTDEAVPAAAPARRRLSPAAALLGVLFVGVFGTGLYIFASNLLASRGPADEAAAGTPVDPALLTGEATPAGAGPAVLYPPLVAAPEGSNAPLSLPSAVSPGGASASLPAVMPPPRADDEEIMALQERVAALEATISRLEQGALERGPLESAQANQQALRMSGFEATLTSLSARVAALPNATPKPEPPSAVRTPAPKPASRPAPPAPVKAKAQGAALADAKGGCSLRGATDGGGTGPATAWITDAKGSIGAFALGASAPCVGVIRSIGDNGSGWTVTGARGALRQ